MSQKRRLCFSVTSAKTFSVRDASIGCTARAGGSITAALGWSLVSVLSATNQMLSCIVFNARMGTVGHALKSGIQEGVDGITFQSFYGPSMFRSTKFLQRPLLTACRSINSQLVATPPRITPWQPVTG